MSEIDWLEEIKAMAGSQPDREELTGEGWEFHDWDKESEDKMDWLEEIKARCEKATPGPWNATDGERVKIDYPTPEEYVNSFAVFSAKPYSAFGLIPHGILFKPDAIFVAHAREDVPRLIAEVERLLELCRKTAREMNSFGNLINWPEEMPMSYAETINELREATGEEIV